MDVAQRLAASGYDGFLTGCREGDAAGLTNEVASPILPTSFVPRVDDSQNKVILQEFDRFLGPECRRTARRTGRSAHAHWCAARTTPDKNRLSFGGAPGERFVKLNHPGKIPKSGFAGLSLEHGVELIELLWRDCLRILCGRRGSEPRADQYNDRSK
jgi:hypothetical protein